jgi:hypothetical protein
VNARIIWGLVCLGTFLWGFALGGAFGRAQLMSDSLPVPLFLIGALCVLLSPALFQLLKKAKLAQLKAGPNKATPLPEVFKNLRLYGRQAPLFDNRIVKSEAYVISRPVEIEFKNARHVIVENWGLSPVRLQLRDQRLALAPKSVVRLVDSEPATATLRVEPDGLAAQDPELLVHFLSDHW